MPTTRSIMLAASLWAKPRHASKAMDPVLAESIAELLDAELSAIRGQLEAVVTFVSDLPPSAETEQIVADFRKLNDRLAESDCNKVEMHAFRPPAHVGSGAAAPYPL